MKINPRKLTSSAAVLALVTLSVAAASAQRMPIFRNVTITLKPDRVQDFIAAVKDYNAVELRPVAVESACTSAHAGKPQITQVN
jgi:hypothetical protein